MARLSKEEWQVAREKWESSDISHEALALEIGVSRPAVINYAKRNGWVKNVTSDVTNVTDDVTGNDKAQMESSIRGVTENATTEIQPPKMGRPTKYKPEYCQQIINHFSSNEAYVVLNNDDDDTKRKAFLNRPITMAGFAQAIGVDRGTVEYWAKERDESGALINPDFCHSYKTALSMQEKMIAEGALAGVYNSNIAQLMLKNHHGYRDVQVNETEVYISKDTEESLNKLYELRVNSINETQAVIEGRFERITRGAE